MVSNASKPGTVWMPSPDRYVAIGKVKLQIVGIDATEPHANGLPSGQLTTPSEAPSVS